MNKNYAIRESLPIERYEIHCKIQMSNSKITINDSIHVQNIEIHAEKNIRLRVM